MSRPLVFVLMSQRSGTSALVHTLNEHPGVAMGIERYKLLWPAWPDKYDASLFEADRFFDLDPSETNILGTERWTTYYARKRDNWGPETVSGDKVQPISRAMVAGILDRTPRARFLYPFRQLLPLASSYAVRAKDPDDANWAGDRGALTALRVWKRDNRAVLDLLEDPELGPTILPIAYEDFFRGDPVTVRAVLDHVGLDDTEPFRRSIKKNAERYEKVQQKQLALTYAEVARLLPHAHDPAYVALHRQAPRQEAVQNGDEPEIVIAERHRRRADELEEQLRRLRARKAVRVALVLADGAGRLRRGVQGRMAR